MQATRVGPLAGIVAVVLTVISLAMTGSDMPDFIGDAEEITAYYGDDPGKLIGGYLIDTFGTVLLLIFVAAVYVRLGGIRRGTLAPASFAGGVAMCCMFMLYDVINLAASFRAEEEGGIGAESAVTLSDLSFLALGVGATMFAAVFVACAGWSALGSGAFPRWFSYLSFVLALGLLIPPISWAFLPVLLVWVVIASICMWRDKAAAEPPAATQPA